MRVGGKQENHEEMIMSQTALIPGVEPFILEPPLASVSFKDARLLEPLHREYTVHQGQTSFLCAPASSVRVPTYMHFEEALKPDLSVQFPGIRNVPSRVTIKQTNNLIRPASRTGVVWHTIGLHGDENHLRFHHINDKANLCDVPPLLRCQVPPLVNFGSTREDIKSESKTSEDTVRQLQQVYERSADYETHWSSELQDEWNDDLKALKMPAELTSVISQNFGIKKWESDEAYERAMKHEGDLAERQRLGEEKYEYRSLGTNDSADTNRSTDYDNGIWSDDEGGNAGFDRGGDHITNEGMRKTQGDRPNDHQERKHWFPWFRAILNEEGWTAVQWVPEGFTPIGMWTPEREAEIRNHPKFPALVALYQVLFSGRSIEELDIDKDPNTAAKWLARAKDFKAPLDCIPESDWQKAIGHYACTVVLNNRGTLKILAPLDAPIADAVTAFNKERQKARRKAIDNARQDAKAKRLGKKATKSLIEECVKRIDEAYDGVLIMSHRGITINDLDDVTPAEVIFSAISRGQPQH